MMPVKWCEILEDKHDRCEIIINHLLIEISSFLKMW